MRLAALLLTVGLLGGSAWARPVTDQYKFYSVPAPDDWGTGSDPLGLGIPGSSWYSSKDGRNVVGVSTLPVKTKEEASMPLDMVAGAMNDQLAAKGFRCQMSGLMVGGEQACLVQGVNKMNQRIAIIVTRRANAVAMVYYLTASSTEVYSEQLKKLVDGFKWARPSTK